MALPWMYLLLVTAGLCNGEIPPPERSYKILMLLPVSSKSHRSVFMPLAEALADRGHKVVMLSNSETQVKHQNIEEIYHGLPHFRVDEMNMFQNGRNAKNPVSAYQMFHVALPKIARDIFHVPQVKELYEKRKEFDVILVDNVFNEAVYPFVHEMPFITIATFAPELKMSAVMGNPYSPAYVQNVRYQSDLSTVFGRFLNLVAHIVSSVYWRYWGIVPSVQREITAQFPDLPPLLELERNLSLSLLNTHFSLEMSLPLLPSQVEIGGMHCRPGEPLPKDLKSWIEGAGPAGVVYFSLGSVAKGNTMPVQYRDIFVNVFGKLKQRVIWKFEDELGIVTENVMIRKWLPQQDILAHPNVKVFISHGGGLSIQEASYHGVPLLVLPIFAEQPKNAQRIAAEERGLYLVWDELTEELLLKSLSEIINTPKYKENMMSVSRAFQDQMEPPRDRAVFWTEYVIRNKGAPKLRCPAADLSWIEFLMLDVLVFLISIFLGILLIMYFILKPIFSAIFGKKGKKKHE